MNQYYDKGFHQVHRKGDIITRKVNVPAEARYWIDRYLEEIRLPAFRTGLAALRSPDQLTGGTSSGLSELRALSSDVYLFVAGRDPDVLRKGERLDESSIRYMMTRIANQACAQLDEEEKFKVSPHMLRHSFGKRVADKHGVHVAQKMLGNVSIKEVFKYTQPSLEEKGGISENLYD